MKIHLASRTNGSNLYEKVREYVPELPSRFLLKIKGVSVAFFFKIGASGKVFNEVCGDFKAALMDGRTDKDSLRDDHLYFRFFQDSMCESPPPGV